MIEICLVKILSTSMACHLVTNRVHHEYSLYIMSTFQGVHDAQVVCLLSNNTFLELIPDPGNSLARDLPSMHAGDQDDVGSK